MVKKIRSAYTKGIEGNTIVGALGSTATVDRDGDIIDPTGIDVTNFMKNPQLLWSHDPYCLPIGKVTNVRITSEGLEFDAEFAADIDPFAKKVRDMMEAGFLNAFSIGFIPHERQNEKIIKTELLEISVVNIPSNAESLMRREYKSFEKELTHLQIRDGTKPDRNETKESKRIKKKKVIKRIIKIKKKPTNYKKRNLLKKIKQKYE